MIVRYITDCIFAGRGQAVASARVHDEIDCAGVALRLPCHLYTRARLQDLGWPLLNQGRQGIEHTKNSLLLSLRSPSKTGGPCKATRKNAGWNSANKPRPSRTQRSSLELVEEVDRLLQEKQDRLKAQSAHRLSSNRDRRSSCRVTQITIPSIHSACTPQSAALFLLVPILMLAP